MSDEAVEAALLFLSEHAATAGKARAEMAYMEDWRKVVLSRLKRASTEKSDAAREAWARAHPDYQEVLVAKYAAIEQYETLSWKKTHAEATLAAWQTRNANDRGAQRLR